MINGLCDSTVHSFLMHCCRYAAAHRHLFYVIGASYILLPHLSLDQDPVHLKLIITCGPDILGSNGLLGKISITIILANLEAWGDLKKGSFTQSRNAVLYSYVCFLKMYFHCMSHKSLKVYTALYNGKTEPTQIFSLHLIHVQVYYTLPP